MPSKFKRPPAPPPPAPSSKYRIAVCLLDSGVAALSVSALAKLTKTKIEMVTSAVTDLHGMGLVTGPRTAVALTARGEDFAARSRGYVSQAEESA